MQECACKAYRGRAEAHSGGGGGEGGLAYQAGQSGPRSPGVGQVRERFAPQATKTGRCLRFQCSKVALRAWW